MVDKWFISDTHFNHENILKFTHDGTDKLIRPGFESLEHMNETIIDNWNKVIKPGDKVYHGGDVAFGPKDQWGKLFSRLNGRITLIYGNHDSENPDLYRPWFKKFACWKPFGDAPFPFVVSHCPLHETSLFKRGGIIFNVHGHIHERDVLLDNSEKIDPHYVNICVEKTNYKPVHFDELQTIMKERWEQL